MRRGAGQGRGRGEGALSLALRGAVREWGAASVVLRGPVHERGGVPLALRGLARERGALSLALRGPARERGAVLVEFTGMAPIILVVLALLWQSVLIGYTFTLAGNAADEGARAAASAAEYGDPQGACASAAKEHLPARWSGGASVSCAQEGALWKARVGLPAPVLFPGAASLPFTVDGEAGAAKEGGDE